MEKINNKTIYFVLQELQSKYCNCKI